MQEMIERLRSYFRPAAATDLVPAPLPSVAYPRRELAYPADVMVVPTLVLSYFPVRDGLVDRRDTGDVEAPLDVLRTHVGETTRQVVHALETGSIYHGYQHPVGRPSLRYEILDWIELLEPLPTWPKPGHAVPMTDYHAILERLDIRRWVQNRGVKEVWIWGYHGGVLDLWESNMAGPFGDVSNSDRDLYDLPVLDRTYTVYHYNYQRGASEAVEDHIHQIEAVLRHADPHLFWDRFVGPAGGREARCGWAHYPPNGVRDYDWANPRYVLTDIEDWTPEGTGPQRWMNSSRWGGDSLTWFIYWMQNLPGAGHQVTDRGRPLGNWWRFIGDFDAAMRAGLGLYAR